MTIDNNINQETKETLDAFVSVLNDFNRETMSGTKLYCLDTVSVDADKLVITDKENLIDYLDDLARWARRLAEDLTKDN